MAEYQLLRDAYYGTGGFATGSYLNKHKRESKEDYQFRQANAYYLNYFSPIVNALVDPIFKRQPLRDYQGPASATIKAFLEDVDTAGADIHTFMKRAAIMAKVYGVSFIVVDNASERRSRTVAEMLQQREIPFAYVLGPQDLEEYGIDQTGSLLYVRFKEVASIKDGTYQYRYTYYDRTKWEIWGDNLMKSSGEHGLGCVPVIPLFPRMLEQRTMKPTPELEPIARTAKALYNHCSWLGEILRNQTFPLLTIPSLDVNDLVVGTNNALGYLPDSSHAPAFIAPPSDPATILQNQIASLIQEMYRMASLSFVISTTQNNNSGIARQWEFERTNQQLANFAMQCARAETEVMELVARWVNSDITYTVSYPDDFGIVDVTDQLAQAQAVLDMNLTDGLQEEVLKRVLAVYCPDMPDERFDELIEDMKRRQADKANQEPHGGD
ncbi:MULTISPECIES: hypothetical protein [unclassified Megasphaera]|uniref:hypothetical protein n=1 Tax=unclassified Megasphaera TaxID=2626256 RepID=UPI0025BCBC06|nr:hypothetical protein [Megasphaera sp. UBA4233]